MIDQCYFSTHQLHEQETTGMPQLFLATAQGFRLHCALLCTELLHALTLLLSYSLCTLDLVSQANRIFPRAHAR